MNETDQTTPTGVSKDQSHMVEKFLIFYEDGCPRDTLFTEEAVYRVTGIKGTQRMLIEPAHLPFKAEIKNRTSCLPGTHIAWVTDSKEKAVQIVDIVTKLKRDVDKLGDFATTSINGLVWKEGMNKTAPTYEPEETKGKTKVNTQDAGPAVQLPVRSRTRTVDATVPDTGVRTRTRNIQV